MDVQKTISSEVVICRGQFQDLLQSGNLQRFEPIVKLSQWKDELGRFRVWVSNIGAHQTCQLSLEYRLRDASHIKSQVMRQLGRLHRLLVDLQDTAEEALNTGMPNEELEFDPMEEVRLIYSDLFHTITKLYEMSIIIRKPSSHDRLKQIQKSDYFNFELNDRQHLYAKFPYASHQILDRLGTANSKRRALLKYRERHRQKLGHGVDGEDSKTTVPSESMATEFRDPALNSWDGKSESDQSMTSYGNLTMDGDEDIAHLNPPEGAIIGQPFECQLCCHIVQTSDRKSWMHHIFSDLMPYVCTFPSCKTPDRLYERRHQWVEHVKIHHKLSFDISLTTEARCVLCQKSITRGHPFDRHLARHLENVSLFAVPRSLFEDWNDPTVECEEEASCSSQGVNYASAEIDEKNLQSDADQGTERFIPDEDQTDLHMEDSSASSRQTIRASQTYQEIDNNWTSPSQSFQGMTSITNGFWSCCACGQMSSFTLSPERCSVCNHPVCSGCRPM